MLISGTEILTAYHVVKGSNTLLVTLPAAIGVNEIRKPARIIGFNVENDLAVLSIQTPFAVAGIDYAKIVSPSAPECTTGQRSLTRDGNELVMETTGDESQ